MGLRKWVFFSPFPSIIGYCRVSFPFKNCLSYSSKVNYGSDQVNYGQSLEEI